MSFFTEKQLYDILNNTLTAKIDIQSLNLLTDVLKWANKWNCIYDFSALPTPTKSLPTDAIDLETSKVILLGHDGSNAVAENEFLFYSLGGSFSRVYACALSTVNSLSSGQAAAVGFSDGTDQNGFYMGGEYYPSAANTWQQYKIVAGTVTGITGAGISAARLTPTFLEIYIDCGAKALMTAVNGSISTNIYDADIPTSFTHFTLHTYGEGYLRYGIFNPPCIVAFE